MSDILHKIEASFKASLKGEETINNLIRWWGIIGYLVVFFVVNKVIKLVHVHFIVVIISALVICYFSWHIYALKKCSPKKIKLSKEEKQKISEENRKELGKKIARKLFLQESITKWNPVLVSMVIDAYCIAQFVGYVVD